MTSAVPRKRRLTTRRKQLLLGAAVVLIPVLAWLAFGYFGIQAAFIDNEVAEEGPVFTSGAESGEAVTEDSGAEDAATDTDTDTETNVDADADADAEMVAPAAEPQILMPYAGTFSGNSRYEITGDALVLTDGTEQRFLRFENFDSSNGPDLNVYLRAEDGSFVDLGDLKGNIGDQNYEIPADVDLSVYSSVEIWCVRFGVGFGQAELMAT